MENDTLLIDTSPIGDFLSLDGEVVWPVKSQSELNALQKLCQTFGSTIKNVSGKRKNLCSGPEEVVALGEDNREAGFLYAHLTKRNFRYARDYDDLFKNKIPSILIIEPKLLNAELLEFLYKPQRQINTAPGIIFSHPPSQLRKQLLTRSAAAFLCGDLKDNIRIDVYPSINYRKKLPGHEILSGSSQPSEIRAALKSGTGLLVIKTHSDGIDASLGDNLTLCALNDIEQSTNVYSSPMCEATQYCHRHGVPIQDFLTSEKIISPRDVNARIFIFNSCNGLLLPSCISDVNWSLGQLFSSSSGIGAVVTTWETVITTHNQTDILAKNLLGGVAVGRSVALHNRSWAAKMFGRHRLCLLGDPRVRLPLIFKIEKSSMKKPLQRESEKTNLLNLKRQNNQILVEFLHKCLTHQFYGTTNEGKLSFIKNAITKIDNYRESIQKKFSKKIIELNHNQMIESVLDHFMNEYANFHAVWTPLANKFIAYASVEKCKVCLQPMNKTNISIKFSRTYRRRLTICPNCLIVEDSPSSFNVGVSLNKQILTLHGKLPKRKCAAKILFRTSNIKSENKVWDWPRDENGDLRQSFEIPNVSSRGSVLISVAIVWQDDYIILKQMTKSFQDNRG